MGRADSAPKSYIVAEAEDVSLSRKAVSGRPLERGREEPPESLERGTLSKGFCRNLGDLLIFILTEMVAQSQGRPEASGKSEEESYDLIVPKKVGNWR